ECRAGQIRDEIAMPPGGTRFAVATGHGLARRAGRDMGESCTTRRGTKRRAVAWIAPAATQTNTHDPPRAIDREAMAHNRGARSNARLPHRPASRLRPWPGLVRARL